MQGQYIILYMDNSIRLMTEWNEDTQKLSTGLAMFSFNVERGGTPASASTTPPWTLTKSGLHIRNFKK